MKLIFSKDSSFLFYFFMALAAAWMVLSVLIVSNDMDTSDWPVLGSMYSQGTTIPEISHPSERVSANNW